MLTLLTCKQIFDGFGVGRGFGGGMGGLMGGLGGFGNYLFS